MGRLDYAKQPIYKVIMPDLEHFDHDVTENVQRLLIEYSETKDDDLRLVATYYFKFHQNLINDKTALDFVKAIAQGRVISSDLITRTRRKLQEHNPELRGKKWKERHQKQQTVKKELKELTTRNSI
jgi:hypothetical protein